MASGDQKLVYGSSAALTITLASLATDANLLTGRESTAVDNSANLYLDELIAGKITTGTTPTTAKTIEVWAFGALDDTPTYPDVFDGTDSAETVTSDEIKGAILRPIAILPVLGTSDQAYPFGPVSLASRFGGIVPVHWGIFVTHDTAVNLNATAGNHSIKHTPVYLNTAP